jgi:hypothetical protein
MNIEEGFNIRDAPFYAFGGIFLAIRDVTDGIVTPETYILIKCKDNICSDASSISHHDLYMKKSNDPIVGKSMMLFTKTLFLASILQCCPQIMIDKFIHPLAITHNDDYSRDPEIFLLASILYHSSNLNMKIHFSSVKMFLFQNTDLSKVTAFSHLSPLIVKAKNKFCLESLEKFFSSEKTDAKHQKLVFSKICQLFGEKEKRKREGDLSIMSLV